MVDSKTNENKNILVIQLFKNGTNLRFAFFSNHSIICNTRIGLFLWILLPLKIKVSSQAGEFWWKCKQLKEFTNSDLEVNSPALIKLTYREKKCIQRLNTDSFHLKEIFKLVLVTDSFYGLRWNIIDKH